MSVLFNDQLSSAHGGPVVGPVSGPCGGTVGRPGGGPAGCIASLFDSITPLTDMTNLAAAALHLMSMGGDILDRKFFKDRTGILSYSLSKPCPTHIKISQQK
jgi:hypothetical protein